MRVLGPVADEVCRLAKSSRPFVKIGPCLAPYPWLVMTICRYCLEASPSGRFFNFQSCSGKIQTVDAIYQLNVPQKTREQYGPQVSRQLLSRFFRRTPGLDTSLVLEVSADRAAFLRGEDRLACSSGRSGNRASQTRGNANSSWRDMPRSRWTNKKGPIMRLGLEKEYLLTQRFTS
jgi:hypothetical protein